MANNVNKVISEVCDFSDYYCFNCPTRFCTQPDIKYQKLINRTLQHLEEQLFWIDVDFEETDVLSLAAFENYKYWLQEHGYFPTGTSFKTWIIYDTNGKPVNDGGYHNGTLYFRKIKKA